MLTNSTATSIIIAGNMSLKVFHQMTYFMKTFLKEISEITKKQLNSPEAGMHGRLIFGY